MLGIVGGGGVLFTSLLITLLPKDKTTKLSRLLNIVKIAKQIYYFLVELKKEHNEIQVLKVQIKFLRKMHYKSYGDWNPISRNVHIRGYVPIPRVSKCYIIGFRDVIKTINKRKHFLSHFLNIML